MSRFKNPLLLYPDFSYLYSSKLIGILCDRFFVITISWWLLHMNIDNSSSLIGMIMGSAMIAQLISGLVMGVLADRYSKKHCMMVALAAPMLLLVILLYIFSAVEKYPQLIIAFYFFMALFIPLLVTAATSGLSQVVPPAEMSKAVALDGNIMFIGQAIGSTLAGTIVMLVGITGALTTEIIFYILAIILAWRIKACLVNNGNSQLTDEAKPKDNMGQAMKEGLQYFRQNKLVMSLVSLFCLANFFMTPMMIALPIITANVLQGTALDMSMLECSFAFGAIFISLIFGSIKVNLPLKLVLTLTFILSGFLFIGIAQTGIFYIMLICLFIIGCGVGVTNTVVMAKMQAIIPDELKGRVFSLIMMSAMGITPIALFLTGYLSDIYGIMAVINVNGACMVLLGIVTYCLLYKKDI